MAPFEAPPQIVEALFAENFSESFREVNSIVQINFGSTDCREVSNYIVVLPAKYRSAFNDLTNHAVKVRDLKVVHMQVKDVKLGAMFANAIKHGHFYEKITPPILFSIS